MYIHNIFSQIFLCNNHFNFLTFREKEFIVDRECLCWWSELTILRYNIFYNTTNPGTDFYLILSDNDEF